MDLKNLEEALKLQKNFSSKLSKNVKLLRSGKAPSVRLILKEKEAQLQEIQKDLEAAEKDRADFMARMDERIKKYSKIQTQLEKEIKQLKENI